jgi:hypothetical protein
MKFGALPPSKRSWLSPAARGTVIEIGGRLHPRDLRAPSPREHGAEITDLTVYRLLKEQRRPRSSARL